MRKNVNHPGGSSEEEKANENSREKKMLCVKKGNMRSEVSRMGDRQIDR